MKYNSKDETRVTDKSKGVGNLKTLPQPLVLQIRRDISKLVGTSNFKVICGIKRDNLQRTICPKNQYYERNQFRLLFLVKEPVRDIEKTKP